jgi:hypothetical protein
MKPGCMSALGQKQTYAVQQPMSALLPIATAKADIEQRLDSYLIIGATFMVLLPYKRRSQVSSKITVDGWV